MTEDLQTIAFEQRWFQPCLSGALDNAGGISWLGGPLGCAGEAGTNCAVRRA